MRRASEQGPAALRSCVPSVTSVIQDLRNIAGDRSFKHVYICFCRGLSPVWRDRCGDGEVRRTLQRNMPALLELFKGTGSIGRALRPGAGRWSAWTSCPNSHPPSPPGRFNFVWASPVCTEYSQALTTRRRLPRAATLGHREPADGAAPWIRRRRILLVRHTL